jgi:coenzyme Q-binding protein COQ10
LPKITFEKITKIPRNKVFEIATNFNDFQKSFPQYFPSIQVKSVRDNVSVVEMHLRIAGRELVTMTKHITKYPETHEIFVIGGDAKGSHIIEQYEAIPEGTKIKVEADLKLKGALGIAGFFNKGKIKKNLENIIDEFAKTAKI